MSDEKTGASTPIQQLNERWNGFIKKIEDRYNEIIQQADAAILDVIGGLQYDNIVLYNILNGLKHQTVEQLTKKIEEAWEKMDRELEKNDASSAEIAKQYDKNEAFQLKLENDFEAYSQSVMLKAADKIYDNVKKHIGDNKMHNCTQCGNELPINVYSFMSFNLKCDSCGSVNTYEPDDRVRALESYVINVRAEAEGFEDKRKGDMKSYYKKYYGYMMEHVPEKKEHFERMMNKRLDSKYFN